MIEIEKDVLYDAVQILRLLGKTPSGPAESSAEINTRAFALFTADALQRRIDEQVAA